jgi:hypothetical protein
MGQVLKVIGQRINKRTRPILESRMHDHSRRLVYYHQMIILKNDFQCNVFRNYFCITGWLGQGNSYDVCRANSIVRFGSLIVHLDKTRLNSQLQLGARHIRQPMHQEFVKACQTLARIGRNSVVLEKFIVLLVLLGILVSHELPAN